MVVILIQTTNLLWFFRALQLSTDIAVLRTVVRLNAQATGEEFFNTHAC